MNFVKMEFTVRCARSIHFLTFKTREFCLLVIIISAFMHEFISTNSFSFNYRFSVPKVWIWASECWLRLPHSGPILFKCFNLTVIHISVDDFHKKTSKSIFRTFNSSSKNDEKIAIISAKLGQIKKT